MTQEEQRDIIEAIASLRGDILQGHDDLRAEMRADMEALGRRVDERLEAFERMAKRITDDHNGIIAAGNDRERRLCYVEGEIKVLRGVREEVEVLKRRVAALDRDVSDADAASRLRDSQHEFETKDVVQAMKLTVENLTAATEAALERTEHVTARAEARERAAAKQSQTLQDQTAYVAKLAASVRKDSWRKQLATMAIVVITGAVGAAFSQCGHDAQTIHDPGQR